MVATDGGGRRKFALRLGVCDLFYYASNIIDDRAEDMYAQEHQVNYHGIDKKQRREIRAKKQAQGHSLTW